MLPRSALLSFPGRKSFDNIFKTDPFALDAVIDKLLDPIEADRLFPET